MNPCKSLMLVIVDGLGVSSEKQGNPLFEANTPNFKMLDQFFPFTVLQASGVAVGLPWGEAGNSEVGHLTIGAGRAIHHHLPRIIHAISDGSFFKNEAFLKAAGHTRAHNSRLHIAGLVSSGSVHSYIDHLYALFEFTGRENLPQVFLHIFTDGKDAPPKEGAGFLRDLEEKIKKEWPKVRFASVVGRYYGLDRNEKWDRTKVAYDLITKGEGEKISSIPDYVQSAYGRNFTDEFIPPAIVAGENGEAEGIIRENDAIIFSDFREDSIREITHAFVDEKFDHFERARVPNLLAVTMTEYQKGMNAMAAFSRLHIDWPLARVLSDAGMSHLHISETQKYAHVTYFLNGGAEEPFPEEERILIPSLADKPFNEVPEMRAREITEKVLENFGDYKVTIVNFANTDMVGHTGDYAASIRAVEVVDECLGKLIQGTMDGGGMMIITSDHGNVEMKRNFMSGEKMTEHTTNPVPFYIVGKAFRRAEARSDQEIIFQKSKTNGILTDVAPTIIELLGLKKPAEMTGQSLLPTLLR